MQCKQLLFLPLPAGFWWLAENVDCHSATGGPVGEQSLHVPLLAHHAVHRGTVHRPDHCWRGNVRPVGSPPTTTPPAPAIDPHSQHFTDRLTQQMKSRLNVWSQLKQWFSPLVVICMNFIKKKINATLWKQRLLNSSLCRTWKTLRPKRISNTLILYTSCGQVKHLCVTVTP